MTKSKLLDTLILILVYIGISCLPFSLFGLSETLVLIFRILGQLVIFFLFRLILKKSPLKFKERTYNRTNMIFFIPVFILCFSNFFNLLNPANYIEFSFSVDLALALTLSFCVAFNEEYLFRSIIIDNIESSEKPIVKVVISASIFAACHLTSFFSTFNPIDLIQVVYTFGLGIVLGMIYVYTESLWYCVLFHFAYNLVNSDFAQFIKYPNVDYLYFLINASVGLIVAVYLVIIYFLFLRKTKLEKA